QLGPYQRLLYAPPDLTNAALPSYYKDESFGIRPGNVTATVRPDPTVPVVIYRDRHDVPHIYGASVEAMAYGAGYAAAHDRLFLMDVLRHYGAGTLSSFLGPSCADEQMDHDQLLLAAYTPAQRQAQIAALANDPQYQPLGGELVAMGKAYVAGINRYIARTRTDPSLLPAAYGAALQPPQPWTPGDLISVASLVGGIFGKGGGKEVANAALLQYLEGQLKAVPQARQVFSAFKEQNDPGAPTTIVGKAFPYEIPGKVNPATVAMPDNAAAPLQGGPTDTTPGCNLTPPSPTALRIVTSLLRLPTAMSNALVVGAKDSASGHPIAVFGPQVGYFAPQILMEEDLHAPDFAAEGAAFPGVSLVVQLGRGPDFAWSATSAGTDVVDQRLEVVCNPTGGPPAPQGHYYEFDGTCLPMGSQDHQEVALPKPGGPGAPTVIDHRIYTTRHGIVQGWTTARGGQPVAVVNQRSTYGRELVSGIGFLRWNTPSLTHGPASWMKGAADIGYTFNWFYVDSKHIAYFASGRDPVRPSDVNPNLPTWGTGNAEWQGFLPAADHPHQIDPPRGFFTSWNNKPAPQFSAADDQYGYGPVYRVQLLNAQIAHQLAIHGGSLTRANLVTAMETAATQDLDGRTVLPELLSYLAGRPQTPGVAAMVAELRQWAATGSHRAKAAPGDAQYAHASAVAIMDELEPRLIRAVFDPLFAAGGLGSQGSTGGASAQGYRVVPMQFTNTPNSGGAHLGSAYDGGWEGYMVKVLRQLQGQPVAQPFPTAVTGRICGGGPTSCSAAVGGALQATYQAMVAANGNSTDVGAWTQDTATRAAGQSMPAYDAIHFQAVGIVGQPDIAWQNRPTFQQVVAFPAHRPTTP
ncbi:MAG TPA: penicillin acylase family protein, partial [Acidimicrobiales bacterium]|nr:penicillin acylase family protein [Acidimicrobiales bacterium]